MQKIYVLDTNILIQSPNAIFGFENNHVVITNVTLQELDKKKATPGETGYNAREAIRIIDSFREKGNLLDGIELPNKGILSVIKNYIIDNLPAGYDLSVPDNRIISATLALSRQTERPVILVTNDISLRVNASICGVSVQGYKNETAKGLEYSGRTSITLRDDEIDYLYKKGTYIPELIDTYNLNLIENEFVVVNRITGSDHRTLAIWRNKRLEHINENNLVGTNGICAENIAQKFFMHALLAPAEDIPLVIAKGPAGTGKTMLAIACGLRQTYDGKKNRIYQSILITRTNTLSDADIGYLPGTLEEKMEPLVASFIDNMEVIFGGKEKDLKLAHEQIDYVFENEIVKICSIAYMRGRSLSNTYLIVDEAQNMTVQQVLEIVSRAGKGTKIVLCGDPEQIDNPKLDKKNNGLVFASERMLGSSLCAQVTFEQEESVRSPLAMEAAKRLS